GRIAEAAEQAQPIRDEPIEPGQITVVMGPQLIENIDPAGGEPRPAIGKVLLEPGRDCLDVATRILSLTGVKREHRRVAAVANPHRTAERKLMGWTPPGGIDVPEWRC